MKIGWVEEWDINWGLKVLERVKVFCLSMKFLLPEIRNSSLNVGFKGGLGGAFVEEGDRMWKGILEAK